MGHVKIALLAAALLAATTAGAQEAQPQKAADPQAGAAARYREGVAAFEAGKFAEALAAFTESYNLSSETDLLYNLGVCSEKVGNREKAIAYYELYLEEKPDAKDAGEVKARLEALRKSEVAAPPPEPSPAQLPVPEDEPAAPEGEEGAPESSNVGPALLTGIGGIVVVTGAITMIAAYKNYRSLEASCSPDCSDAQVGGVRGTVIAADVQLAVGGAAVAAGLLWWLIKSRREESGGDGARVKTTAFAAADGGGVLIEGRF